MRVILLPAHIVAGLIAIATGFVALYALKGAKLHRQSGKIFSYAMLVMAACGVTLAVMKSQPGNIVGGSITLYLVTTAQRALALTLPIRSRRVDMAPTHLRPPRLSMARYRRVAYLSMSR